MAAAYASLVSINQLIEQIQLHHTRRRKPSYSAEHLKQIESLNETTSFLQEFLEKYSIKNEVEFLENDIRDVVDAAQDIIESHMVDYILSPSVQENISSFQGLEKVMEDINSIKEKVMEIEDRLHPRDLVHPGSLGPPSSKNDISAVEVGERLNHIMAKLTRELSDLQIIPITGMGGIGKTTLAKKVYDHPYRRHFDICAWVTISQKYNIRDILSNLLDGNTNKSDSGSSDYHELGNQLHQHLCGRRFLIVIDDMWDTDVWDTLQLFIPNNNKGSRILVTTRLLKVAEYVNSSNLYEMDFLDENESWSLLCRKAFGQEGRPNPEFEEIAKRIAKNCKGLPLSIIVIAGFIAKSKLTREFLESVVDDTNRTINSEDSYHSLRILLLSYNHLPIHLKPCLLHMGAYPEDHTIDIEKLIRLWVAEGFLKPNKPKILEEVAEEYLKDLIERNLIMVVNLIESNGRMTKCVMHDLIRDLCLRESDKSKFLCVTKMNRFDAPPSKTNGARRIVHHCDDDWFLPILIDDFIAWENDTQKVDFSEYFDSIQHARSLTYYGHTCRAPDNLKLLRVLSMFGSYYQNFSYTELYNLRYIDEFPMELVHLLNKICTRNLQTITFELMSMFMSTGVTVDIWKMLELRHLECDKISLSDPPPPPPRPLPWCGLEEEEEEEEYVLENLQTLSTIVNFKCTEEVIKRIPNVKRLQLRYYMETFQYSKNYSLNLLDRLLKLESLDISFRGVRSGFNIRMFPPALTKLVLWGGCCVFDDSIENIGQLPNLEDLALECVGVKEWVSVDEHFCCLKFLNIKLNSNSHEIIWIADSSHFPALERLILEDMHVKIPSDFAYSTTLRSIVLYTCTTSTIDSARNILKEQESLEVEESIKMKIVETGTPSSPPWYLP